ncbi:MAG: tRNA dihydrouridine synthase DusB [Eggerthellaceae bacterium]|nr:tRNA dihydrouridine synthase DusB [Eggerthellaceae bacterium]
MAKLKFNHDSLLLAPMAGLTGEAFRGLCIEQGADFGYTEMVSAEGLFYGSAKTREMLRLAANEGMVAVQLFGHRPLSLASEAAWIQEQMGEKLVCIDINMGCPARKIVGKGDGCALMNDPQLAAAIVAAVVLAVDVPVTVKFRRGYHIGEESAVEFAQVIEEAGAAAVAVHGRYAQQYYQGRADWQVIARVKQAISIPVIGNGDVVCAESALAMKRETRCDAIMIGRGAQGNPWVFAQAKAALRGLEVPEAPGFAEKLAMARRHTELLSEHAKGKRLCSMRRHAMHYIAGMQSASQARGLINSANSLEDFNQVFDFLLEKQIEYRDGLLDAAEARRDVSAL